MLIVKAFYRNAIMKCAKESTVPNLCKNSMKQVQKSSLKVIAFLWFAIKLFITPVACIQLLLGTAYRIRQVDEPPTLPTYSLM